MEDLSKKAKRGAIWLSIRQFIIPTWEFGIHVALARMLTPHDFGVVAMGMVFFRLAVAISTFGIGNVIIQKKNLEKADIVTAQTISSLFGVLICSTFFLLSPLASIFFMEPLAGKVLSLFSLNFVINSITMIAASLLMKDMRFKINTMIDITASFIYGVSAILGAFFGLGLFSLVYAPILSALFKAIIICIAVPYLPRFGWNKVAAMGITKFGGSLTLASILDYIAMNVDSLIVGKFLGAEPLGLYKRAYDLAMIPKEKVADTLNAVFFPFACEARDDRKWIKSSFLKLSKSIALACFPALLFAALSAEEIIRVVYGEKWLGAACAFQFMALGGIFYSVMVPCGSILIAYGRMKANMAVKALCAICLVLAVFLGINFDIGGVSFAVTVTLILFMFVNFYSIRKIVGISIVEYFHNMRPPIIISLTITMTLLMYNIISPIKSDIYNILLKSIISAIVYVFYIFTYNDPILFNIKRAIIACFLRIREQ